MNFDAAARAYVRYVLEEKHLKPGALALKAGISASTLTRALNDPKHKFKLSMTTLEKIASFSGISFAPFLEAKDSADLTARVTNLGWNTNSSADKAYPHTVLIGETAVGKWREPSVINYFDYGPLTLRSTIDDPKNCFGCFVGDDSADLIADRGDVFFCRKIDDEIVADIKRAPNLGAGSGPVIVEKRSRDAFRVELTCRLIKQRKDGMWDLLSAHRADHFEPESRDRPKVEQITLEHYSGNGIVKILGFVEWVIRSQSTTDVKNWLLFDVPDLLPFQKK